MPKGEDHPNHDRRTAPRATTAGALSSQLCLDLESDVQLLSPGGMMIRLDLKPELGSTHAFTLSLEGRSIEVSGVVRDVHEVTIQGGSPQYDVGLEFDAITPPQREFISAFLAPRSQP